MRVTKAVITAAGRTQRALPLQTYVDRDGTEKTALEIILDEVTSAGVNEICLILCPGDQDAYAQAARSFAPRLVFIEQHEPRGYGHALSLARDFVLRDPFLHLVSDHLYLSRTRERCAQQVVQIAENEACAVSAVQATRETMLAYYGVVGGRPAPKHPHLFEIETVLEKPTPSEAEQKLIVPGLRAGHYLGFFGMHVLTPTVMDLLDELLVGAGHEESVTLSPALAKLAARERYLALQVQGIRYNTGVKYGILMAQLALALDGDDRENVLAQLVEMLAVRSQVA